MKLRKLKGEGFGGRGDRQPRGYWEKSPQEFFEEKMQQERENSGAN